MRRSAAVQLNVRMAETRGLSDFSCSVVVGARRAVLESDSLLRFGALQVSDDCYSQTERERETPVSSRFGNLHENSPRRPARTFGSS